MGRLLGEGAGAVGNGKSDVVTGRVAMVGVAVDEVFTVVLSVCAWKVFVSQRYSAS